MYNLTYTYINTIHAELICSITVPSARILPEAQLCFQLRFLSYTITAMYENSVSDVFAH